MKPSTPYWRVIAEVITRFASVVPARGSGWKRGERSAAGTGSAVRRAGSVRGRRPASQPALDRALDQSDLDRPEVAVELPVLIAAAVPAPDRQRHHALAVVEADPPTGADPGLHARGQS